MLLAAGLLAGLLFAEAACRLAERLGCVDREELFWEPNRLYGWGHAPGTHGWAQRCLAGRLEWRAYSSINTHGLRDDEVAYERTDAFRILVLGDSFAEALQVAQEDGFTKQLERALGGRIGSGRRIEVINSGVGAWATDNELLYYRTEGWKYRADVVLLAFFTGNDVIENDPALIAARGVWYPPKPYFALDGGRLALHGYPLPEEPAGARVARRARQALRRDSALARLLFRLRVQGEAHAATLITGPNAQLGIYLREYPGPWREAWRITRGLVLRLRQEVEGHGSRLVVVVINDRGEVATNYWRLTFEGNPGLDPQLFDRDKANRLITNFLARRGIPAIPLLEAFRARFGETGTPGFFPWDGHWDRAGHLLAAEVIARELPRLLAQGPRSD